MKTQKILMVALLIAHGSAAEETSKKLQAHLSGGTFATGIEEFSAKVADEKATDSDRFALAVLHFFQGVESMGQGFYGIGLNPEERMNDSIPFLRMPVPANPEPRTATLEAIGTILKDFQAAMGRVIEATGDEIAFLDMPLDIADTWLDLNGNGKKDDGESVMKLFELYSGELELQDDGSFVIRFDAGDAYWLKGYAHLLSALVDIARAHDWSPVFELVGHYYFTATDSELVRAMLPRKKDGDESDLDVGGMDLAVFTDFIAAVQNFDLPPKRLELMASARRHLLAVIACSRASWKCIEAEEDDRREWIPNAKQQSVTGARMSEEMIAGWKEFLDEFEMILEGKKLIPHPRFGSGRGVNLKKVFENPTRLNLILWVQGKAALPYIEEGELSDPETWDRINDLFQGEFVGFAIWIN